MTPIPARPFGFTLLEIVIVIAILSLLVGMLAPNILGRVDQARVATARTDISTIMQALELYKLDNHDYPSTQQGLAVLTTNTLGQHDGIQQIAGTYLKQSGIPKDPWSGEYLYLSPGQHGPFDVYSLGADGKEDGVGINADIGSWEL